jgi:SHS2 domain-containing protein
MTAMVVLSDECARATVKAATYADMAIRHTADGWETTVTFDA